MTTELPTSHCPLEPLFPFLNDDNYNSTTSNEAMEDNSRQDTDDYAVPLPSAPPQSSNNGLGSDSMLSSFPGELFFTPSPSSSGRINTPPWVDVESTIYGVGLDTATLPAMYPNSLTMSSPSGSSRSLLEVHGQESPVIAYHSPMSDHLSGELVPEISVLRSPRGTEVSQWSSSSPTRATRTTYGPTSSSELIIDRDSGLLRVQSVESTYHASIDDDQGWVFVGNSLQADDLIQHESNDQLIHNLMTGPETIEGFGAVHSYLNTETAFRSRTLEAQSRPDAQQLYYNTELPQTYFTSPPEPHEAGFECPEYSSAVVEPWQAHPPVEPSLPAPGRAQMLSIDTSQSERRGEVLRFIHMHTVQSHGVSPGPSKHRVEVASPNLSEISSSPRSATGPHSPSRVKKKGPLTEKQKREAKELREMGACWPCIINREKCSPGEICSRCLLKGGNSKGLEIGCRRVHIEKGLVVTFIPVSMDPSQQYDAAITSLAVHDIGGWYSTAQRGVEVPFSIGIGPPFRWECHEYVPTSRISLQNSTWNVGIHGDHRSWERKTADSPPLGIKDPEKLGGHLEQWIEEMIDHDLEEVQDMYYWEGHQARTEVLTLLCALYRSLQRNKSPDASLLCGDLRKAIALVLVTYITTHAFTIEGEFRENVLKHLSNPTVSSYFLAAEYLVLKTANNQLKHALSVLRNKMNKVVLTRLQTILHHASYKKWRLSAFVLMLGLALTLEEHQHLLHVRADARAQQGKGTMGSFQEAKVYAKACVRDAEEKCRGIDKEFGFLQSLYHLRYSIRQSRSAIFTEGMGKVPTPTAERFIDEILRVSEKNSVVFLNRRDLEIHVAKDNHVLRLAGRYLTSVVPVTGDETARRCMTG